MGDWLERVFDNGDQRMENLSGRAEDRVETATDQELDIAVEVELEIDIEVGLEGSWTDADGQTREWGHNTELSTGETDLGLNLSSDISEYDTGL